MNEFCRQLGLRLPVIQAPMAGGPSSQELVAGKPARGLANRFMREMEAKPQLAFPAQNSVTGKLRQASAKAGKPDFIALWAGQATPLSRALPAAELIGRLDAELRDAIRQLEDNR